MAPCSKKRLQVHINKTALCQSKQIHTALPATRNSAPVHVVLLPRHQNLVLLWQMPELGLVNGICHDQRSVCAWKKERWTQLGCLFPFFPCWTMNGSRRMFLCVTCDIFLICLCRIKIPICNCSVLCSWGFSMTPEDVGGDTTTNASELQNWKLKTYF